MINFSYFYCILNIGAHILKCTVTRFRMVMVSVVETVLYCVVVLLPGIPIQAKVIIGFILLSFGSYFYTYKVKRPRELFYSILITYPILALLGGSMSLLNKVWNQNEWNAGIASLLSVLLSEVICCGIRVIWKWRNQEFCNVHLCIHGEKFTVLAFIDNGNGLREPISQKPVSIMEEAGLPSGTNLMPEKFRIVPFHALGTDKGILNGYEADSMVIEKGMERITVENPIIAFSGVPISGNGKYQMILHPELLKEREE